MAVSLLTYANRAKVAEALTAGGYPVTRVTVNRWASGSEMPGIAARMILELFGHRTQQSAAPQVAERLESAVDRLERAVSGLPELAEVIRRVADDAEQARDEQQHDAELVDPAVRDLAPG